MLQVFPRTRNQDCGRGRLTRNRLVAVVLPLKRANGCWEIVVVMVMIAAVVFCKDEKPLEET